jgi:hypothetical protein
MPPLCRWTRATVPLRLLQFRRDEEDDPNFVSDTTNKITFKQKVGPNASRIAIRNSDMVAAVTYS